MECKEAKKLGLVRYTTGRPCKRGHLSDRFTMSGNCCQCSMESRLIYQNNAISSGRHREATQRWKDKNKEKASAHSAVRYARRIGYLEEAPCKDCGSTINIQAHHEDYSKPLRVIWLCADCHTTRHRLMREAERAQRT